MKRRQSKEELYARWQSEVGKYDAEAVERYKAAHDGLTPIQYAISQNPSAAKAIEKAFPHLVPSKKEKP